MKRRGDDAGGRRAKERRRELLRVREVDRAWAREGFRRGELNKLKTALKSTPVLQLERGEMGRSMLGRGRRPCQLAECLVCEPRQGEVAVGYSHVI